MTDFSDFYCTFAPLLMHNAYKHGQSYTTSSLGILQDGNIAKVLGCSGAI